MHTAGVGHVLVDHFTDAEGCGFGLHPQGLTNHPRHGIAGSQGGQTQGATGEVVGIQAAEQQVGIGDGRLLAATAIAGRAGSDAALCGPTRIWRMLSMLAMEPPPAPISTISTTGMEIGMPLPFLKR
jgi:hypothetical protein